ncbi:MAG: amidohydrolase family protein [Myxococcota bacterium]
MLIRSAEVAGERLDVRCHGGRIEAIGRGLAPRNDEPCLDAAGGALIPGLHDHHLHFFALAAALESIDCGPPQVASADELARALHAAPVRGGWLRGTGYFESVAGPLDRARLDALGPAIPLRIQHRSGVMWFLNSPAIALLGLEGEVADRPGAALPGIERDGAGRATGRLFRADAWLRARLPEGALPDLGAAARALARVGITSFTDATPTNDRAQAEHFRAARRDGRIPQRVRLMGDASLAALVGSPEAEAALAIDARKLLLDEPALPPFDTLVEAIVEAHAAQRGCAFHCVTRVEIHFALAALEAAGASPRDRIEHASIAPPEAIEQIRRLGIRVVTQPNFAFERGDDYHSAVAADDLPHLYCLRAWLDAGVPLAAGTDAPYGSADPWLAIRAAVDRTTRSGAPIGSDQRLSPEEALSLFAPERLDVHGPASRTGDGTRIAIGQPADLCLLDAPWARVRGALSSERVAAVFCGGRLVHSRWPGMASFT